MLAMVGRIVEVFSASGKRIEVLEVLATSGTGTKVLEERVESRKMKMKVLEVLVTKRIKVLEEMIESGETKMKVLETSGKRIVGKKCWEWCWKQEGGSNCW